MNSYPKVTRVEVIDNSGRAYTEYNAADVQISFQDDERTLKVFLKNLNKGERPQGAADYEADKHNINWGSYEQDKARGLVD